MTAIILENLHKSFGDTRALQGISARIASGRLTGLVGPDGAGKTTLIRLMAGLLTPDRGRLRVAGLDPVPGERGAGRIRGLYAAEVRPV